MLNDKDIRQIIENAKNDAILEVQKLGMEVVDEAWSVVNIPKVSRREKNLVKNLKVTLKMKIMKMCRTKQASSPADLSLSPLKNLNLKDHSNIVRDDGNNFLEKGPFVKVILENDKHLICEKIIIMLVLYRIQYKAQYRQTASRKRPKTNCKFLFQQFE